MRRATRLVSALLPAALLLAAMGDPAFAGPHGGRGAHFGGGGGGPHYGGGSAPHGGGGPAFGGAPVPHGGGWSGGGHGGHPGYRGAPPPGWSHGGWYPHGGYYAHGYYPHNRVFIVPGAPSFFFGAGWPYYYGYPYYYPYSYPYPYYGYPTTYPPPAAYPSQQYPRDQQYSPDAGAPPPPDTGAAPPPDEPEGAVPPASGSSYGFVQLRSVPEDATVDLDGRFWVDARQLDERWLPVAPGLHTITVRPRDGAPLDRRVDVSAGGSQVVSMDSFSGERG
jgi:hypothetical protein